MGRQQPLDWRQRTGSGFHHIVPGAAMNVDVNKTGRQYAVAKIHHAAVAGNVAPRPRGHFRNDPILHQYQRLSMRSRGVNNRLAVIAIIAFQCYIA